MTSRGAVVLAIIVSVAVLLSPGAGAQGESVPVGAPVELSPEVAAVPATSTELDRLAAELDRLVARRDELAAERTSLAERLPADRVELAAVTSLGARRDEQLDKAGRTLERSRRAVATLTVDRFIEGDHLLEGLDPALSSQRREELGRQMVLAQVGAERLVDEQRHARDRRDRLRAERDELGARRDELADRIDGAERRTAEIDATLAELTPRIAASEADVAAARRSATVRGTDMSVLALDAYWRAARQSAADDPDCALDWSVLAGIGRTESRHGTYRDAVLGPDGVVRPGIYGPDLDGSDGRFAVVPDSDGGALDATARTDRAVGPMQFLPGTWRTVGTDGTGDGVADPQNLYDAARSAAAYLCRSGPGLGDAGRRRAAILTYNRSQEYADLVQSRAEQYAAAVPIG